MTAPAAHFAVLHVDNIQESKTNPRKSFGDLDELAASVREKGVLSPVKVRTVNGHFELVYGARRLRAAKAVGLAEIPALVQEMSDKEVLEEQLVENSQRTDVPPLEEAEGFKALIEKHGYSPDDLAVKVGKSKRVIYERIQLCKLGKEGRKALDEGRMNASVALLVARIPGELQAAAVKDVAARDDDDPGLSYRRAVEHVHGNYMLQLKDAPFSLTDAALVAKAGACSACPKRTGNQPELFADVKAKDVCTDPKCYRGKEDAVWQIRVAAAKEAGQNVVEDKKAKELFRYGSLTHGSEYADMAEEEWIGDKRKSIKSLLGKDAPPPVLARDPESGKIHELVPRDVVQKAIRAARPKKLSAEDEKWRQRNEKNNAEQALRTVVGHALLGEIVKKVEARGLNRAAWAAVAASMFHDLADSGSELGIADRRLGDDDNGDKLDQFEKSIPKMKESELLGVVVELALDGEAMWAFRRGEKSLVGDAAKALGVDVGKVTARVKAEAAEKEKTAPTAAAKTKPAASKVKKPAKKKGGKKK